MRKEFILDSETKLVHVDGRYWFLLGNREQAVNEDALRMTQEWIDKFGYKYPGYVIKKQRQYEHFIK